MKKNFKNNIAQKGGLMIEALAMLGLIAVVTPTMYKKSAERTLEVEDINTADTIRSYMGATEAYMAANYRGIIKEMTENADGTPKDNPDTVKEVTWSDIQSYMPYGFKNDKALYDYNTPKIALVRQGSNLSAFALFPAKSAGGLGQERTSRIASLIGANGGYTKADKSAHGIGGVWNLNADEVTEVFGSNNNNEFSLVTASSNVINSTSGAGQVENNKYLQRTKENDGELWRNAMRTDLYMGGGDPDADPEDSEHTENHNILNINSLIVGAEKDMEHLGDDATSANNGLYIKPDGTNPNAYIGGTITALTDTANGDKFIVGQDASGKGYIHFGKTTYSKVDGSGGKQYPFRLEETGKITTVGDLDLSNANQAAANKVTAVIGNYGSTTNDIKINNTQASSLTNPNLLHGEVYKKSGETPYASLSLLSEEMFKMTTDGVVLDNGVPNADGTHILIEKTGFKGADKVSGKSSVYSDTNGNLYDIDPKYTKGQTFPVVVGSNMMVKGVMSAGQLDAQHLRTADLYTGSANIDDNFKWLQVNKDGIEIRDPDTTTANTSGVRTTTGQYAKIGPNSMDIKSGNETNDARILMERTENTNQETGEKTHTGDISIQGLNASLMTNNPDTGKVTVRNGRMGMQIKNRDMTIGVKNSGNDIVMDNTNPSGNQYRVIVGKGGNVDMIGSNLQVMDNNRFNILTVRGRVRSGTNGETLETQGNFGADGKNNDFIFRNSAMDNVDYNIATHGNVLFSSMSNRTANQIYGSGSGATNNDDTVHYMAVGPSDEKAGVNIAESTVNNAGVNDNEQRVVFVDLSASNKDHNTYVDPTGNTSTLNLTNDEIAAGGGNNITDKYEKNGTGTMKAGMVYVRKGLVDIVPDKGDVASATDGIVTNRTDNTANDGSGIIRASRFVANNINAAGNAEKVPDMLDSNLMKQFNGNNVVRYDTYMVNPAYTSVMKDIKLTTRGGARLSDVLPDFITKGIYLANNTYDDALNKMQFILQANKFEIDAGAMGVPSSHIDNTTKGLAEAAVQTGSSGKGKYSKNNWASPFSGLVPAPQCPPGYGRVITINPFRYEMAQAGKLALSADSGYSDGIGNASGYYVNTLEMGSKLNRASYSHAKKEDLQNELEAAMPKPRKLKIHGNIRVTAGGGLQADGRSVTGTDTLSIADESTAEMYSNIMQTSTNTTGQPGDGSDSGSVDTNLKSPYVLTVGEVVNPSTHAKTSGLSPLVFQQSTWFHTEAIPVVNKGDEPSGGTYAGYSPNKYIRGWAVLQGFLYHQSEYANFACEIDSEHCKQYVPKGINDNYEIIWNLFPVAKNSLGSYVTTYCYFDRLSLTDQTNPYWKSGINSFEKFDILNEVPISYEKGKTTSDGSTSFEKERKQYYDQLNDPTMKYNEVW